MSSLKTLTTEQLFQALNDARNDQARVENEIVERLTAQHPRLFPAMRRATQVALDRLSMMASSRIR